MNTTVTELKKFAPGKILNLKEKEFLHRITCCRDVLWIWSHGTWISDKLLSF